MRVRLPAVALPVLVFATFHLNAADWPQWRGPNRDGISTETGWSATWPEDGPKELWRAKIGSGYSAVSVVGNRVYTMGNAETYTSGKDTVWCLDADTGKPVWEHTYSSKPGKYAGPRSTPTIDGDLLFTMSRHGNILCLNTKDGSVAWQKDAHDDFGVKDEPSGWGLSCSPLVHGDKLILDLGKVLVLDKKTGALAFALGDDPPAFSSPALFELNGRALVTSFNATGLVLYDLADRKEVGRHKWDTRYKANATTPVVSGDRVFISSGYGEGRALLKIGETGLSTVYRDTKICTDCSTCVLYKDHLYGVDANVGDKGTLKCMDFATGEVKWEQGDFKSGGGIMIADGKIIHMHDKGDLVVAEASSDGYKELARARVLDGTCWTMPVLANGRIYCRNSKGTLVCLDVSGK